MIRDNVTGMRPKPAVWLMCVFLPVTLKTVIMPWRGQGFGNGVITGDAPKDLISNLLLSLSIYQYFSLSINY